MFVALVVAHPSADSYCRHLAARAVSGLGAGGHEVEVLDLYADGFRVAMSAQEREAYHGESPICDPLVARYAAIVQRSDAIVFVYPTWWSTLPAILKGWLERVMVPGVSFRFDERSGKVKPALGNIRTIVGISTYGSSRSYVRLTNDNGRRILTRALRGSCGFLTRTRWLGLYGIDSSDHAARADFAATVERAMADMR